MKCFEFYLSQSEKWSTPSIVFETSSKSSSAEAQSLSVENLDVVDVHEDDVVLVDDPDDEAEEELVSEFIVAISVDQEKESG